MKRTLAAAFLLLTVVAGASLARIDGVRRSSVVPVGVRVADIVGVTLAGHDWNASAFEDVRWILVYVNERCGHCHAQLAAWEAMAETRMGLTDLAMVVASRQTYDSPDLPNLPTDYAHERVLDPAGSMANALGITVVPTTIVFAGNRVEWVYEGPIAPANVLAALEDAEAP